MTQFLKKLKNKYDSIKKKINWLVNLIFKIIFDSKFQLIG